ncbi:hypothetical protein ABFX02_12G060200 [Erythranthe guttata]
MSKVGGVSGGAAPTGCYKCGRPGHWSRDCPSNPNSESNNNNADPPSNSDFSAKPPLPNQKPKQKPPRRTRPKLTPDLLLSDSGVGHILRYFPRAFKCRGRGHEVNDLRHLLRLYAEWHSHLLPYYNFDQFIHKVEQVGATKRVKICLRDLREKVANGIDHAKLQEPEAQQNSVDKQDSTGDVDMPSPFPENDLQNEDLNSFQEDMPQSIWEKATQETSQPVQVEEVVAPNERVDPSAAGVRNKIEMSEEQKERMEANRLKALERAAARSRSLRA